MSKPLFPASEELKLFVTSAEPDQFANALTKFSIRDLAESFLWLQTSGPGADEKCISLFEHIVSSGQLKALGTQVSVQEFTQVLNFLSRHHSFKHQLSLILIGLPPQVFCAALNFYQTAHLTLFKEEALFEPLHYHLTQFVHEGEALGRHFAQQLEQFEADLSAITPQEVTGESLVTLILRIDSIRNPLLDFLEKMSVALSIVWNTDRVDLIEKLSTVNEALQHQLVLFVGHPHTDTLPATGLYLELEKALSKVFDSNLRDDDAATEGLTRLAVWQLKDYWELGLLPQIQEEKELNFDPAQLMDSKLLARHQQLLFQVQKQLEHLGIGTVRDLKRKHLFSKALLKTYVEDHSH